MANDNSPLECNGIPAQSLQITVFRTAMCGGGLSYDVLIPVSERPEHARKWAYTIVQDGKEYIDFDAGTIPLSHFDMPQGWERYDAFLAHQREARKMELVIAKRAFPELCKYSGNSMPSLWVCGLLEKETHAVKTLDVVVSCTCSHCLPVPNVPCPDNWEEGYSGQIDIPL